jgi:malate dehydrogenase (oxaloacetate-decarboxylating)(NADP+)
MSTNSEQKSAELRRAALDYHEFPVPGKIAIAATKQLLNQHDLALAYSPGVAAACEEIVADPANAFRYTARGNLVAVITNGTAVLGLGDIGPLAAKPVMEGKGVLFKKFAGIDVFDIEVNEKNLDKLIDLIAALEPTFGGINLEDIKAPDCFYVERALRSRMRIPVFHDDQHGTAIVVGAGVLNALKVSGKKIDEVKLVTSGAGAAAIACLGLLVKLGIPRENIWVTDLAGVVYRGRTELMDDDKIVFAQPTSQRTLAEVIAGADIFLGLSAAGVLKPEMVATMAPRPIVFALANPTPEILPEEVHAARNDAIVATGRTDYPNQINNVLCFPGIFRGALDAGAQQITEAMKLAAAKGIAEVVTEEDLAEDYIIPSVFNRDVAPRVAEAVVEEAKRDGVARRSEETGTFQAVETG